LDTLGPGAHPARMFTKSTTITNKAIEDFIGTPPLPMDTKQGHEKSQNYRPIAFLPLNYAARRNTSAP
jgi:hypothetical protein